MGPAGGTDMADIIQIRGTPPARIAERYAEFVEEFGEPIEGILILSTEGKFWAHAFTGPRQRLSSVLGLIELAKLHIHKQWTHEEP